MYPRSFSAYSDKVLILANEKATGKGVKLRGERDREGGRSIKY